MPEKLSCETVLDGLRNAHFARRHIGPSRADVQAMLSEIGCASLDDMVQKIVPDAIRSALPDGLPKPLSEARLWQHMRQLASENTPMISLIGQGFYNCHIPAVLQRNILENPGWYTAYTPYQPEISQGRLEALLTFQTMICELTGLPVANASMLDEGSAAADAMTLSMRHCRDNTKRTFLVDINTHPHIISVLRTRAQALDIDLALSDLTDGVSSSVAEKSFGILLSYPGSDGHIQDWRAVIQDCKQHKMTVIMTCDLLALTLLEAPGKLGADIAIGQTQRFGMPMGLGGPHAAFFAVCDGFKRQLPGRIVGISRDSQGNPAYRLALQTREQHIRREKATSNICTAQALPAVMAAMYGCYHGAAGLKAIATRIHCLTQLLAQQLQDCGYYIRHQAVFDTLVIETGDKTTALLQAACTAGINLRHTSDDALALSLDEASDEVLLERLVNLFRVQAGGHALQSVCDVALPASLQRCDDFMQQSVFRDYASETAMMRYLRRLMDRDLALDRTMIPLGSCTMKLNAAVEMMTIGLEGFMLPHPFAPREQLAGYIRMIEGLEDYLAKITGFDAVSLQPNAGAQGEYAGLLAIRRYHESCGQAQRRICLIPSSAHGTNPASAILAGFTVVNIPCDDKGAIDIDQLAALCQKHQQDVAAIMITYPSTYGIFDDNVQEVCRLVHEVGGQVYMDGANMNAQIGLTSPAAIGADVCHLNLHKTFCIPHGGGGPGVGPIAVRAHLAEFLPGHDWFTDNSDEGAVASAPFGSALILAISYSYILLMGAEGLTAATMIALLNANYIARRLSKHYPLLFTGTKGYVAHEVILDLRAIKSEIGVDVADIACRLMDYGFHAPTMSWPVAHTMMIEPTESEDKTELDRFCDAMIAIADEITAIQQGEVEYSDSMLANAPHTAFMIASSDWSYSYNRLQAAYPTGCRQDKYWPNVARLDHVYGDRNLFCSCG